MRAGERIKIPSPIDVHVHLREPGGEYKETIRSGTAAARVGGYQAVFDMPNNPAPHQTWDEAAIDCKSEIALRDASTDIGFYAGFDLSNPDFNEIPRMIEKSCGLKLYMDVTTGNEETYSLDTARQSIDAWIAAAHERGITPPILLHAREEIGMSTVKYVAGQEYPVHWCHLSTNTEAAMSIKLSSEYPEYYTAGVTPHHLTMTERNANFQQGWNGARMQPPLGDEVDAEALLYAYNNGGIQILETDHAPHSKQEKLRAETMNPEGKTSSDCVTCYGVSGIEFVLPVMTSLVKRKRISMERLVDSLHAQPIKMLGLNALKMSRAETTIEIEDYIIGERDRVGKSSNTPYFGWIGGAKVLGVSKPGSFNMGRHDEVVPAHLPIIYNHLR